MSHRPLVPIPRTPLQVALVSLAALVPMLLASGAVVVARQCSSASTLSDVSQNGNLRAQAATTGSGCTNRHMYVWVRLESGLTFTCEPGSSGSQCYASQFEASAFAYANRQSYGQADACSTHQYRVDLTTTGLQSREVTLNAGDPPEEPPDCGPGNIYNESTGLCEIGGDGEGSPIVIATGRGSDYTMTSAAEGVLFDLNGDGVLEQIAWTPANSDVAFLAIDRDGDGRITSGKELFGNFTYPGVGNGFAALSRMNREANGGVLKGSVNSDQPLFAKLLLWTDTNHNGISESDELQPAAAVVSDIGLSYEDHHRKDGRGNEFRYRGWVHVRTAPGRNKAANLEEARDRLRYVYDVFFGRVK